MSGSNISGNSISLNVANGERPTPSKIYSFNVTMQSGTVSTVDLRGLQNINILQQVQGMFVDNSANATSATIEMSTGMSLLIPGYSQGFFPIFIAPNNPVFVFTGVGTISCTLTNFAVPASVWGNVSLGNVFTGVPLAVKDAALEATISPLAAALQTVPLSLSSGDGWIAKRVGNVPVFKKLTASGATVFFPASPSAYVTGIFASLTPDATLAVAGSLTVTLLSSSIAVIAERTVYVPAAASNLEKLVFDMDDLNVSPGATDAISVSLSSALAAGGLEVTLYGGSTTIA